MTEENSTNPPEKKVDIYRDTLLRYLGYANEVGESFRSLVHVNWVRFSYAVASTYVCADALSKGGEAAEVKWPDESTKKTKVMCAVVDTLVWQGLASVAIPGFTINRICWASGKALQASTKLPTPARKWTVTLIGLASIPLIIKPIDHSVDWMLDNSLRKMYGIGPILNEEIVHHTRND